MRRATSDDRPDLGAMLHRLARIVLAHEEPLLDAHGMTMWEYAVLSALAAGAAPTQVQLATLVGRDPTRLIPILDALQGRGLVHREADPRDRRNRIVRLSPSGQRALTACRGSIRAMEAEWLADLPAKERQALLSALTRLWLRAHRTAPTDPVEEA